MDVTCFREVRQWLTVGDRQAFIIYDPPDGTYANDQASWRLLTAVRNQVHIPPLTVTLEALPIH